ncbi:hypothetical protein POSPLADRAFT_1057225 [Postia placenta MAD-698-R-SB12]|uniref:Uncharacterized protein n=1 Tax=Postia placenta MAD-698-R-SB12 TaxID=670580 RepID=A0A1X6MYM1_9APHY|nr:hypothetical protein POSPLADRAFT_1057225 [Postia placenta MAD-698-R-SB12]OSX61459.1 hypothetical protein POSPLADRAFT_1057225 [Postia placenta MAD-698-R-SB12]
MLHTDQLRTDQCAQPALIFPFKCPQHLGFLLSLDLKSQQRSDHQVSDEDNNTDQVVLRPERFRIASARRSHALVTADQSLLKRIKECSEKDREVAEALEKVQDLGPPWLQRGFEEWNAEQGLLLFRRCVYVAT